MRLFYEIFSKMVYFVLKFTKRVIFVDSAAARRVARAAAHIRTQPNVSVPHSEKLASMPLCRMSVAC
jgi:hypothetical protein